MENFYLHLANLNKIQHKNITNWLKLSPFNLFYIKFVSPFSNLTKPCKKLHLANCLKFFVWNRWEIFVIKSWLKQNVRNYLLRTNVYWVELQNFIQTLCFGAICLKSGKIWGEKTFITISYLTKRSWGPNIRMLNSEYFKNTAWFSSYVPWCLTIE